MTKKYNSEKTNRSLTQAVGIGVLLSIAITLLAVCISASLIVNERCNESMIGILSNIIAGVSAFIGAFLAVKSTSDKYALISGITVSVYVFLLFAIGILFFESTFYQPWSKVLWAVVGGVFACIIALKKNGNKRSKKSYHR